MKKKQPAFPSPVATERGFFIDDQIRYYYAKSPRRGDRQMSEVNLQKVLPPFGNKKCTLKSHFNLVY